MRKKLLIALAIACSAGAHAEFKDGNKLLSELNHEVFYTRGVAMGYIMGVSDAGAGAIHCAPPNVTAGQVTVISTTANTMTQPSPMPSTMPSKKPAKNARPMNCPKSKPKKWPRFFGATAWPKIWWLRPMRPCSPWT